GVMIDDLAEAIDTFGLEWGGRIRNGFAVIERVGVACGGSGAFYMGGEPASGMAFHDLFPALPWQDQRRLSSEGRPKTEDRSVLDRRRAEPPCGIVPLLGTGT